MTIRYGGVYGSETLRVDLPPEVTVTLATPSAAVSGGQVTWTGLKGPKGSVQVRVAVDEGANSGLALPVSAALSGAAGGTVSASGLITVR